MKIKTTIPIAQTSTSFVIDIPVDDKQKMEEFQELMDEYHDEITDYIHNLSIKLGVSEGVARDIWYLRTRSRWTQDLENQIIAAAKAGNPINSIKICNGEWPEK